MTASRDDEKISRLIAEHGHAAYGIWWLVMEAVAARVERDSKPEVTYHVSKWSNLLSLRGSHVRQALLKLEVTGLVTVEWNDSEVTVRIPNLLKYRDEWTRKSGVTPESLRSKEQIQNTDTEAEEIPQTPAAPKAGALIEIKPAGSRKKRSTEQIRKTLGDRLPWWEAWWSVYPCHEAMRDAMDAFERRFHDREEAVQAYHGAVAYAAQARADPTLKLKYGQGWINGERWLDENKIEPRPRRSMNVLDQALNLMIEHQELFSES